MCFLCRHRVVYYTEEEYCRQAFDPNAPGLDSLQWDSAELLQIGVQDHMSYDDAFTIEEVQELTRSYTSNNM